MALRMLPLPHTAVKPKMAHLTVEPETGEYHLVLVQDDLLAKKYNSRTGQWTKYETFETMYGFAYRWEIRDDNLTFEGVIMGTSVYKQGTLSRCSIVPVQEKSLVISYAFMKNRMFVLVREVAENVDQSFYAITEIELCGSQAGDCAEVATRRCEPFEVPPQENYKLSLYAVSEFLIVFASIGTIPPSHHESGWLYCLATRTWSDLSRLPKSFTTCADGHDLMCEIKWECFYRSVRLFISG